MYGIYANIGGILMVNVTIYSIHGSYGYMIEGSGNQECNGISVFFCVGDAAVDPCTIKTRVGTCATILERVPHDLVVFLIETELIETVGQKVP